jgi:hypothetical protein
MVTCFCIAIFLPSSNRDTFVAAYNQLQMMTRDKSYLQKKLEKAMITNPSKENEFKELESKLKNLQDILQQRKEEESKFIKMQEDHQNLVLETTGFINLIKFVDLELQN